MVWQHSLWNVDKRITGWNSAFRAHFSLCQHKTAFWVHKNQVLKQFWESIKVTQKDNNKQLWQQLSGAGFAGLGFKLQSAHKRQKQASWVKENPVRCEDPTNCPREEWKWEQMRGREGGVKKRKGTPLSLYYPSVTGLLGSYYGYSDSRLSVLLTIAHKGSIQLWATMQIALSHFLSVSFLLHFILFTSV